MKKITLLIAIILTVTNVWAQWSWQISESNQDLWMRSYNSSTAMFDFRLGGGGCVAQMRYCQNSYQSLLSPTFFGEETDRVMQFVYWGFNVIDTTSSAADKRYNINQAGNASGQFTQTMKVDVYDGNTIDVYSLATNQWDPILDANFTGKIPSLTRYQLQDKGVVKVTKYLKSTLATYKGNSVTDFLLYLEQWLPFKKGVGDFDALALGLDKTGTPNWWYLAGNNIPYYPNLSIPSLYGYAMVYKNGAHSTNVVSSIVFGQKQLELFNTTATGSHNLNSMDWNNGIGILPSITVNSIEAGSLIAYQFYIVPATKSDSNYVNLLNSIVPIVESPKIYGPTYAYTGDLLTIKQELDNIENSTGTRTNHLAPLVSYTTGITKQNTSSNKKMVYYNSDCECITIPGIYSGELKIIDVQGKIMSNKNISGENLSVNVSELSKGLYFIQMTNKDLAQATRFVK